METAVRSGSMTWAAVRMSPPAMMTPLPAEMPLREVLVTQTT
jgi:hypothetical protein